jgi:hypothetical protein
MRRRIPRRKRYSDLPRSTRQIGRPASFSPVSGARGPFRSNALIQVLNRLSDDDKATTLQMSQSGKTLFTSDQDEVVRLGNGFATHSRWSMHANDRSATFDLPRDGKPIAEFIAWCQEEKT